MSGIILVGGAYFTDSRIGFKLDGPWTRQDVPWEWVHSGQKLLGLDDDWYFVFGIKRWTRRLKKAGVKYKHQPKMIADWLKKVVGKAPLGVLDDCNLDDELGIGDRLRNLLFTEFDCRVYLLREYLKKKTYDKRVVPFSIPCQNYSYLVSYSKMRDLYFWGNASHGDRKRDIKRLKKRHLVDSLLKVYKGGEKAKEKLAQLEYLREMAKSRLCLCFAGAGYCTFRYQEIPSVGSVIAIPKYPWVVRNDYRHLRHCIKYEKVEELIPYLKEKSLLEDMADMAHGHFLKYHATPVRYNEWLEYLDEVRGH